MTRVHTSHLEGWLVDEEKELTPPMPPPSSMK